MLPTALGWIAGILCFVAFVYLRFCKKPPSPSDTATPTVKKRLQKRPLNPDATGYVSILCEEFVQEVVLRILRAAEGIPQILTPPCVGVPQGHVLIYVATTHATLQEIIKIDGVIYIEKAYVYSCPRFRTY